MHQYPIPQLASPASGSISLPGSKSIALRQMAISALVEGTSTLKGIPVCDDIEAMLDCLLALGVNISVERHGHQMTLSIDGPMERLADATLDARMSGASTRLLLGLASMRSGRTTIDGHPSLRVRTNQPLYDALATYGCEIQAVSGGLPATIEGPLNNAPSFTVDGSISSQYITALMIIAPALLAANHKQEQIIEITGELVSKPYLDITIAEMSKRGASVAWSNEREILVKNQPYTAGSIAVEGDATAASYFLALATLHGSKVSIPNLGQQTEQGDFAFAQVMVKLGARLQADQESLVIEGPEALQPLAQIDMTTMPDAALTLIAMAPLIPGETTITGLSTLHHKECDRLECSARALQAMGVGVTTTEDSITVPYTNVQNLKPHLLNTHHDHRMAMAFSTLGSISGTITVDNKAVVAKTYPHYWDDYESLAS